MAELRLTGRQAAAGLAAGPIALLPSIEAMHRRRGSPEAEAAALRDAIAAALRQLGTLAEDAQDDGAGVLGFQIAMLEDDALSAPALDAIAAGTAADEAWQDAIAAQVADYESADDEHFRARASDLRDIGERVLRAVAGACDESAAPPGSIVFGEDLTPSRFLATDWSKGGGIALTRGSASGHVATLARARGVPMIVGIRADLTAIPRQAEALIDGEAGVLCLDPAPATRDSFLARVTAAKRRAAAAKDFRTRPAVTADGTPIAVLINVADPREVDNVDLAACDGIGLVRTEFLFHGRELPDEQTQYRAYRRLAEWASGKPVTIRTLDAGGDKPIPGLTIEGESNPFLGTRGIRLSLARPDPFRTQLRALARAAVHGAIEIMLPMVAAPRELAAARRYLDEGLQQLSEAGIAHRRPPLGMMVEVPAAAIAVERFDADFFSIGSNDLTQYVLAAARDLDSLAELSDPMDPAVLRLMARVAGHGAQTGRKVSLCGDAAGEPKHLAALLATGLRTLSVAPSALARTKEAIAGIELDRAAT
ncbi:MAG: phosphoenolpyruvate--protein phosphotransferase [Methylobacteriaceae bacterium]|nr:phosphoenolpyruvate--protein phosphotransferase [Methylobacteriaceae bacterium]